jgi:hypothetical protein
LLTFTAFFAQPALLGCSRWLGFATDLGLLSRFAHKLDEALHCVLTVSILAAEPLGLDHQCPTICHAIASQGLEALAHLFREGWGIVYIKAKLHGRGGSVYMLASRPRGSDKLFLDLILVNDNILSNANLSHRCSQYPGAMDVLFPLLLLTVR